MCQGTEEELLGIAQWFFPHIIRSMRVPIIIAENVATKIKRVKLYKKNGKYLLYFLYMQNVFIQHLHIHNVWFILTSEL